ncbi:MAG: histidine phosphatase family protein [Candidatus Tumulicola sp.]
MIVLCRHGSTDANIAGAFLSKGDPPLNALGRSQSERARIALREMAFGVAFTSPMRRCVETLALVAPHVEFRCEDALREVDFGEWEGRTLEWLEMHDPEGVARRRRDPVTFRPARGESFLDVSRRLQPFATAVRAQARKSILLVGHRGTLGVLERMLRNIPLDSREPAPLEPGEYHIVS